MAEDDDIEMTVETVVATTAAALLCKFDTGDEVWVPRVYCRPLDKVGDTGEVSIPYWLAVREGLV